MGGRPPEASNGRREVPGTASSHLTLAATTAAVTTTADTMTEGRWEVVAAVVSTMATGESLTAATAAAAAAAAAAEAEAEDTVAGSKSG